MSPHLVCGLKIWSTVHQLLGARQDLKGAAMFLFERAVAAKGKNREPGLQENSVRNFIERQVPWWTVTLENYANDGHFLGTIMVTIVQPQKGAGCYQNSVPIYVLFHT